MTLVDTDKLLSLLPEWAAQDARVVALIKEHKAPAPALQQYGIEQFQAGQFESAVKAFEIAAALVPEQPIYQNNLGVALNAAGDAEGAIAAFRASLKSDAGQPQIWLNLAHTLKPLGRLDEAEQALTEAAKYEESASEAAAALGMLALERGDNTKAIPHLQQAIKGNAGNASLHAALGAALFHTGQPGPAADSYKLAATLNPAEAGYSGNADFLTMLAGIVAGDAEPAITAYARPLEEDAVFLDALNRALAYFTALEKTEAALALVDEWLQYYPEDEDALYFEQVLSGKKLSRASTAYLAHHFDRLSAALDMQALRAMKYQVPEQMAVILAKAAGRKFQGDVLDAGCGNGGASREIKPFAKTMTGIDLSPRMAALARESGLYDAVIVGDLLPFLQGKSLDYDLIVAADSLIYFGALEFVFAAAHAALRPGGWFLFNVETGQDEAPYTLMANGRFRHAKSYIAESGAKAFTLVRDKDLILRFQAERAIEGTIFLFQKS